MCGIHLDSIYHNCKQHGKDLDVVLEELTVRSTVFNYVPGRFHRSFKDIKPHLSEHVDIDSLFQWIKKIFPVR